MVMQAYNPIIQEAARGLEVQGHSAALYQVQSQPVTQSPSPDECVHQWVRE